MSTETILSGLQFDMSDEVYHARTELSSTGARRILDSPARFQWEQTHRVESIAFDVGHAVHAKVLGKGPRVIPIPDEHLTPSGNVSTKAATVVWLAEQRAAGLVPIGPADAARIEAMVAAVLAHKGARKVLEQPDAHAEVSAFATDPETGVACRARLDLLAATAADLKTTAGSASAVGFGREAAKHGYPIQEAHYLDVIEWATGERPPMVWVVVEKSAPHLVAVHALDDVTRLVARELAAKARRIYAECLAANDWPGYGDDTLTPFIPSWWINQADDEPEMEFS
jgi:exodeoxyribonuclease VIII